MKALIAILFAAATFAQPLTILCGSPTDQYYSKNTAIWAMPAGLPPAIANLRYAPNFTYDIPLANGLYNVSIVMAEPNTPGNRVMTVTAQGQVSAPINIFALAGGANIAYTLPMLALVGAGMLHLQFMALPGSVNAVVSEIVISPALPLIFQTTQTITAGVLNFNIGLAGSANAPPAALQWTLNYPPAAGPLTVTAGPAATAAAKTVTCSSPAPGSTICVLVGVNQAAFADGVVAQVSAPSAATVAMTLTGVVAASGTGGALPLTGMAASAIPVNALAIGPLPDGTYMPVGVPNGAQLNAYVDANSAVATLFSFLHDSATTVALAQFGFGPPTPQGPAFCFWQ